MNALIQMSRDMKKIFFASLMALMLPMMATSSQAAPTVFLAAGNTCAGGTVVNFSTSGSTVQVSLCVTNTGEPFGLCGQSSKLQSANAGENGRFNITARTLGTNYADPNNTSIPFPLAINNPPPTSDLGGTSTSGAPVAPAASQLLATFDLSPQASATNASYVLSTSSDSILSVDTDNTCSNPTDVAIPASITMNLVAPTFTVTPSAGANGAISPNAAQIINSGATTAFTVTPNAGFSATVGGTCGGTLVGTTYTTNAITGNCTVSATFAPITFTVTPSAGANGAISPNTAQVVNSGSTTMFTVTPSSGFAATVGGTCGGTLVGNTYTTNAITGNCTVSATFAPITFTVTPSAGANGAISPNTAQVVNSGSTTAFTVTPNAGFAATVGGTCGGTLVGNTYTTNAITANCTVSATFAPITFTVTPSAGANGTISPNTAQVVNSGSTTMFTVTPSSGFSASVGGTCGGTLVGNTYTTNAITGNCTVSATFAPITFTVTPSAGANGAISPNTAQVVNSGSTTMFTVTPSAGFAATVGGTCGGTLVGNTYTTNAITGNCTVSATFAPITFTVTPSAGANGAISPNTAQVVNSGSTTVFTVTPNVGFFASVAGTCGGTLVGTTYTTNAITANCTVSATFAANLALSAVQSRKTHGAAGTFDIPIDTVPLVTGNVTTEPRIIGAGHTIVFQFNQAITATGTLAVTDALGATISTANAVISGTNVIVTITGISDIRARIALTGVTSATGMINAVASVGFLAGDASNNRSVNASDIIGTRNRLGAVNSTNFRYDVDISGVIDAADVAAVRAKSVSGL
jgi:hypothetical protein